MIEFVFRGKTHDIEVDWALALKISEKVGDPHKLLAKGDIGLTEAVKMVSLATGLGEIEIGTFAMREDSAPVYKCASEILLATIPSKEDAPEVEDAKKD